jgi:hypothetical protein
LSCLSIFCCCFFVKFYFYCIMIRQYAGGYFNFLMFIKTCFVT